jgi:dihydroorotate dehydrogenase
MESLIILRNSFISLAYKHVLKPVLFRMDPEFVHERFVVFGKFLGSNFITKKLSSTFFGYSNNALEQNILGIHFSNPVGLAAGFDYDANLTQILPHIGFGFGSVGSITHKSYGGNTRPMLGRLPKSKSLLVNKGLKNKGVIAIIHDLSAKKFSIPIGISVAKTNCRENALENAGIKDYVSSLKLLEDSGVDNSYFELNISCPNAFGGEPFTTPDRLSALLSKVDSLRISKPLFLKMPTDLSIVQTSKLCSIASRHAVSGLIFGNLTKDREHKSFDKKEMSRFVNHKGAFSGRPTSDKNDRLISFAYKNYGKRFVIIGCGGIFTAADAYRKIKLGASLLQLITGMIFEGPAVISSINQGLVRLLEKDGFSNISQAVGNAHK